MLHVFMRSLPSGDTWFNIVLFGNKVIRVWPEAQLYSGMWG